MSAVVLRCSNCGTTQSVRGECEACHEAEVGYYCTNHSQVVGSKAKYAPSVARFTAGPSLPSAPQSQFLHLDLHLGRARKARHLPHG